MELSFVQRNWKMLREIAKILRNNHSIFVSNVAIFNRGRKFDWGRFWSRARQPLPGHERFSRNQQINAINWNFRQVSSEHFFTLEHKFTFSSQNRYQKFIGRLAREASKERKLNAQRENLLVRTARRGFKSWVELWWWSWVEWICDSGVELSQFVSDGRV